MWENRLNIFVKKVGENDGVRITSEKERSVAGFAWAANDRLIYAKDTGGDEN
ncbi:hypothetical protein [Paenibacillus herberti]|uniref:hypothetical protein n=1 Tax=Paenibacillus herberti TaxID=1619309 RepID=UPI001C3C9D12|nr:hypothetical protein [Paenibacillus herberti]